MPIFCAILKFAYFFGNQSWSLQVKLVKIYRIERHIEEKIASHSKLDFDVGVTTVSTNFITLREFNYFVELQKKNIMSGVYVIILLVRWREGYSLWI